MKNSASAILFKAFFTNGEQGHRKPVEEVWDPVRQFGEVYRHRAGRNDWRGSGDVFTRHSQGHVDPLAQKAAPMADQPARYSPHC